MKKFIKISAFLEIFIGVLLLCIGIFGIKFSYDLVVSEKIITPKDAVVPEVSVRGPITLLIQADTIRTHVLQSGDGRVYAEIPNEESNLRNTWITALTLMTALNLGVFSYILFGLISLFGVFMIWVGVAVLSLNRRV